MVDIKKENEGLKFIQTSQFFENPKSFIPPAKLRSPVMIKKKLLKTKKMKLGTP